ncbi:YihA family ribosome biogenesis GTP-binding protein [Acidihalobacter ferrooxydans]|uniref:Probable GTP-binding protein EngB n=2 Tax=Acidihalobacter ferrooxydans TaxID=1765967 RepID=A0A1P8UD37_9GAMM|nr:ribosome biogenesis GTP-binding protein YihA/YsxC [Acidihalobacter ferrooxydans]APZ41728.1 YihA family ribosome biogenesis GTP-binding protein [Acidihalobacter ferrooxydans]
MHGLYQNTRFIAGATNLKGMPSDVGREVAFAGRSNAGKSSALNRICHQKSLARTSKTPGRTQQINFFQVTEDRYLVDLPGYGYARVPGGLQREWGEFIGRYLECRRSLAGLIILMDIRRPLTTLDEQLLQVCVAADIPAHILLTKADKLSRNAAMNTLREVKTRLANHAYGSTTAQCFSALRGEGLEDAQARLDAWLFPENAASSRVPLP